MSARRIRPLTALLAMTVLIGAWANPRSATPASEAPSAPRNEPGMDSLVTVRWLNEHLDDPDLVVLDATVRIEFGDDGAMKISSGRDAYERGHIPTAGFADLTADLVDTASEHPYAIPSPEQFAAAMGALGVGDDTRVVVYASDYSAWAARVWWMLRWIGHDDAAVLDGGLAAWTEAGYPLSTEAADEEGKTLSVAVRPDVIAERDEVFAAIEDDRVMLIDAMPAAHYRGEIAMYGRPGHIPSAVNVPTVFADDGRFLSAEILEEMHLADRDTRTIVYCGGGISASANAFAMHRLGFTDVAVYMNSLDEWAADSSNPLTVVGR